MKTSVSNVRIQEKGSGGGGGGIGPTPPPPPKPENVDTWNEDEEPPRNSDGTPEYEDGGDEWVELPPGGDSIGGKNIGGVVPEGSLGDKGGDDGLDGKGKDQLKEEWDRALIVARGEAPEGIKRALERLKRPVVDWRGALDRFIDEAMSKSVYQLPNRRFLGAGDIQYGRKSYKEDFESIVIAIDTSGSISKDMIKVFLSEVMGICEIYNPQKTVILYCDTQVYAPDILAPGDTPDFKKIRGGGGTNFWPPFKWVERNMIEQGETPSVFIYFTDGEAQFPTSGDYSIGDYAERCIWVFLTFTGSPFPQPQPFGERIDIALANKGITEI